MESPTIMDLFLAKFGKPDPPAPSGLAFATAFDQLVWETTYAAIGAGWYRNRFLYLFGEGLEALRPCLEAWRFLLPRRADPVIVGRNAYGAILVIEDAYDPAQRMGVLDPLNVNYFTDGDALRLGSLIGRYLPEDLIPGFLDSGVYVEHVKKTSLYLDLDLCLAIKKPLSLGGRMEASNFRVESLVDYYRTTGPIYEKALKSVGRGSRPAGKGARAARRPPADRFREAAFSGDAATCQRLLQDGIDVNAKGSRGETALMGAAESGQTEIVRLLVAGGADLDLTDNEGDSALLIAARRRRGAVVTLLLDVRASLETLEHALSRASDLELQARLRAAVFDRRRAIVPPITTTLQVEGVELGPQTDYDRLVREQLEAEKSFPTLTNDWFGAEPLVRVLKTIADTPQFHHLSRGVGRCLTHPDPGVRSQSTWTLGWTMTAAAEPAAVFILEQIQPEQRPLFEGLHADGGWETLDLALLSCLSPLIMIRDPLAIELGKREALRPGKAAPIIRALKYVERRWVVDHWQAIIERSPDAQKMAGQD